MGKKYRELKRRLLENPVQSLLVVDDAKIRKEYFSESNSVLKRIDRFEIDIRDFQDRDQRLYQEWFNLTFRKTLSEIDDVRADTAKLARYFNWTITISRLENVSLAKAYRILKKEEIEWSRANESEKSRIEEIRAEREMQMERLMREDSLKEPSRGCGDPNCLNCSSGDDSYSDENVDAASNDPEGELGSNEREMKDVMKVKVYLNALSDAELRERLNDSKAGGLILETSLSAALLLEDGGVFLRPWRLSPPNLKTKFAKTFNSETCGDFNDVINSFDTTLDEEDDNRGGDKQKEGLDDRRFFAKNVHQKIGIEEELRIKTLYRSMVRKLHPDLNGSKSWSDFYWSKLQEAYQSMNLPTLLRLDLLLKLRKQDLSSMTVSEILSTRDILEEELSQLRKRFSHLKRSPAWRFSRRKDFEIIRKRAESELLTDLRMSKSEREAIQSKLSFLENMAQESQFNPSNRKAGQKRKKKQVRKEKARDFDQMSFKSF